MIFTVLIAVGTRTGDADYVVATGCPPGFEYTVGADGSESCFQVVLQYLAWSAASTKCSSLNPPATLAVITSAAQQNALTNLFVQLFPASQSCLA